MSHSEGLTLVEMIVVVGIVGVLATVLYVNFSEDSTNEATLTKAKAFATSIPLSLPTAFVSEWKFNGDTAAGSAALVSDLKDTWGANDGTPSAVAPTVREGKDCISEKCLEFNGSTNSIAMANMEASFASVTVSSWVNIKGNSASGSYQSILNQSNDVQHRFSFYIANTNKVPGGWIRSSDNTSNISFSSPEGLSMNRWHHVVYTLSGTNMRIYIDGDKKLDATLSNSIYTTATLRATIGSFVDRGTYTLNGSIDDIHVYKEALTVAEIQEQYRAGLDILLSKNAMNLEEYNQRKGICIAYH
jgi:prepilin-type N-terminal cleavage/methylation domain-containing protein